MASNGTTTNTKRPAEEDSREQGGKRARTQLVSVVATEDNGDTSILHYKWKGTPDIPGSHVVKLCEDTPMEEDDGRTELLAALIETYVECEDAPDLERVEMKEYDEKDVDVNEVLDLPGEADVTYVLIVR